MSGPGLTGAQAVVDIKTKELTHTAGKAKKESDVEIKMAVDPSAQVKVGMQVKTTQAAALKLTIVKPAGMTMNKETPGGPLAQELEAAFPSLPGQQWVAFSGQTPAGSHPKLNLETELEVDSATIPAFGFQFVPVVMTRLLTPYNGGHYLVGTSLLVGSAGRAMAMGMLRARPQAAATAKATPKPKPKPKLKKRKR